LKLYGFSVCCGEQQLNGVYPGEQQLNSVYSGESLIISETVSKKAVESQEAEEIKVQNAYVCITE
jgi:hypothetical protein